MSQGYNLASNARCSDKPLHDWIWRGMMVCQLAGLRWLSGLLDTLDKGSRPLEYSGARYLEGGSKGGTGPVIRRSRALQA